MTSADKSIINDTTDTIEEGEGVTVDRNVRTSIDNVSPAENYMGEQMSSNIAFA